MYILFVFSKLHRGDELMYMQVPQVVSDMPLPPCPRCGKQALVKSTHEDIYTCLNCSFRKDVNESYWNTSGWVGALTLISVGVISSVLISVGSSVTQYREAQPQDSPSQKTIQTEKNPSPLPRSTKPTAKPIP
jgi:hypothetical protein